MFPINKRFHELCRALKIDPRDGSARHEEGTREFHDTLRKKLSRLLGNRYCLIDGALCVEDQHTQGLAATLRRELTEAVEKPKSSRSRTLEQPSIGCTDSLKLRAASGFCLRGGRQKLTLR